MVLRVIGAGFGRTGTDSMREALTVLGFGPCHHMSEVNRNPDQKRLWRALAAGAAPDWALLFQGYESCVDWPSSFYWRALSRVYPDARIILTVRPAESWWESYRKTILSDIQTNEPESLPRALIARQVFGGKPDDKATVMAAYEANTAAVIAEIPADRLLVYAPGDGWEPLCRHLGVDVPESPFPHTNTAKDFVERLKL